MSERFHIDFSDRSDGDLILTFRDFAVRCERHPAFRNGYPECVPGPPRYVNFAESLTQLVMTGPQDKNTEQQKLAIREMGARCMTFTAQYVVMFSHHHNDPSLLNDLGLELVRRATYKKERQAPPAPSKFQVKDLPEEPGAISVSVSNRPSKGSIEVQVNEVSPTSDESWRRLGNYYECRFTARGLGSVKKYWVRARFDTSSGPGPWSEVIAVVVS